MSSTHERVVDVFVEVPRGSRTKYRYDERSGRMRLDPVLFSSVRYLADHGFVEDTLAGDGDPLVGAALVAAPRRR